MMAVSTPSNDGRGSTRCHRALAVEPIPGRRSSDRLRFRLNEGKRHPPASSRAGPALFQENEIMPLDAKAENEAKPQRLHLVFGGELKSLDSHEFRDVDKLEIVGLFPDYASAERAWRAKAQATVDSAQTRYYIVHLHRLIEPDLAPPTRTA
jgi:Domain of unknown function (DUF4170)